ncbi:phospholipase/carboxylesterase [Phanerochaete sordida]|uniref:Acyl-protein thioesterase 1 n=1 Tax=Phanerochaete sordida TaxID=48140 RepID=A0A9P3LA76_9APHY|nr:phospholipase/carboxylesterase [Phanerochaete sordida]
MSSPSTGSSDLGSEPEILDVLEVHPREDLRGTVIFLHGLGQRAQQWRPAVQSMARSLPGVKWILPQSPSMPITMYNHEFRRAWFDLEDLPPTNESGSDSVCRQINHVLQSLEQIVHAELHGRPQSPKVVVAGFSQGGATAMMLALTSLHEIGGVASLSGWIPHISRPGMRQIEPSLPVFWGHGTEDPEVPLAIGQESTLFLQEDLGLPEATITFRSYEDLGHDVCQQEMQDLAAWLDAIF